MKKLIVVLLYVLLLTACSNSNDQVVQESKIEEEKKSSIEEETLYINGSQEKVKVFNNIEMINIEYKDRIYILSEDQYTSLQDENDLLLTHSGEILDDFSTDDIAEYQEFADFYKVTMKDGSTYDLFDRPDVNFDPIESNGSENIVKIEKHGDHYHVIDKDGNEYITYEDPSENLPDLEVEEYHGDDHDNHDH